MSDDCVFEGTAGPEAWGTRYAGPERVRAVSEWVFTGTTAEGKKITFRGGKIAVKSSFFKNRTA